MALILVIDDDPTIANLVRVYLDSSKYEIMEAKNAFDAEDIIYKYRVALLLVDINMPFQNGFDFVQKLKRSTRNKLIATIFMTARSEKHDIQRAANLNVDGYIVKPFTKETLSNKIDELFRNKHAAGPSYAPINIKNMNWDGQLLKTINFKIENISEFGLSVISDQQLSSAPQENAPDIITKSTIWNEIGIDAPKMAVSECVPIDDNNKWRIQLVYKDLSFDSIETIRTWIERTQIERKQ